MTLDDANRAVIRLKLALAESIDELSFEFEMHFPDVLFRDVWNEEIPAPGISKRSGVYLILNSDNEGLYIGKATKNNLAAEIYSRKFKKVTSKTPVRFNNSELAEGALEAIAETIRSGTVKLAAFVIEPVEPSSLVEVYLHTLCHHHNGWWPPLNKQIG
jgi:hypothetical protein